MLKNNLKTIRMGEFYLTKREFSKKLDIAEQQYLRYESGQSNPSLEIAIKISNTPLSRISVSRSCLYCFFHRCYNRVGFAADF